MNAIWYNGRIYPQYRVAKRPTLVVISGAAIAQVGHDLPSVRRRYPKHRLIDLEGRAVIPGLVDSHTHFYFWARTLNDVHLDGITDFGRALDTIRKHARQYGPTEWITGDGWSADRWQPYHLPTARELDEVTGGRPAALYSKDQHAIWANSRALELAGIDRHTPDPEGGRIERDPHTGEPTGLLKEIPAYGPVERLMSAAGPKRLERSWQTAARIAYSKGITGFHSVDAPAAWQFFQERHVNGRLGFRVHYYFPVAMLDELIAEGIISGMGDDTLRVGGVKLFTDGSLGAQSALMKQPYHGRPQNRGVEVTTLDQLLRLIGQASRHMLACAVHAIGDRAVANVITAYIQAAPRSDLRHRIEHLQLLSPEDLPRLKKSGVIASMQPSHCPSDRRLVDTYWGKRGRHAYIFGTLLKHGVPLTFGSDCPIEPLDPMGGIHAAVNRTGYGERGGRFYPEESLTVAQAVHGFTAGPAYAAGRESFSGKIAPGYQADLVILDDDLYTIPRSKIHQTRVAATVYTGRPVYGGDFFRD